MLVGGGGRLCHLMAGSKYGVICLYTFFSLSDFPVGRGWGGIFQWGGVEWETCWGLTSQSFPEENQQQNNLGLFASESPCFIVPVLTWNMLSLWETSDITSFMMQDHVGPPSDLNTCKGSYKGPLWQDQLQLQNYNCYTTSCHHPMPHWQPTTITVFLHYEPPGSNNWFLKLL